MLLSPAEIRELTGRSRRDAQARALRGMGIEHKVRPDGTIAVSRAHVERVLGGEIGGSVRMRKTEPDFSRMKA
jgi:hypothetical protein